jgi:hypothetical protein
MVSGTFGGMTESAVLTIATASTTTPSQVFIPLNTWTTAPTDGFPIAVVGYDNLIYAPDIKKFVMWENYQNLTSETNEAMLAYDFGSNRWDVWGLNGNFHSEQLPESGHGVGMLQYNPNNRTFISYCCHSGSQGYDRPMHTWIYDPAGLVGRDVQTPTMPGLASEAQAAFDSAHNVYVMFEIGAGTWVYDPARNTWTRKLSRNTTPKTSGYFSAMTYNSKDQKIYLFGGIVQGGFTNDLFTYDVPTDTWTKLNPTGSLPSGRKFPSFAYDSTDNVFLMFGGQDASGILNDTWIYDPAGNLWQQMSPGVSPPIAPQPVYQRLAYDRDDNVFMLVSVGAGGYLRGPAAGYSSAQVWFYRYKGTGPNAGTIGPSYSPTPGSINRDVDGWANEPVLTSSGETVYAGWIETGRPFNVGNERFPHVYACARNGSRWTPLGSSYLALDSEFNGFDEAHAPSMAVVSGTPWISWYKTSNSGTLLPNSLYAKYWNGTAWIGGAVGAVNTASKFVIQSRSQLAAVASTPYIAFLENDRSCYPWCQFLYVKRWDGSAWSLVGTALNRNAQSTTASPRADSVSMASDGTSPFVAWVESTQASTLQSNTPSQVYVSKWNGSAWQPLGGSVNVNSSNWAYDASIAVIGDQLYIAWVERSQTGTPQLYVKTWKGSAWSLVGSGSLNKDMLAGWAFRPVLAGDDISKTLYLAWVEQQDLGQKAQTYVLKYQNGVWSSLGGALNADPAGSAERVALAVSGGQPVVAWGEVKSGSLRQIYVRQWNNSAWTRRWHRATKAPIAGLETVSVDQAVTGHHSSRSAPSPFALPE